MSAVEPSRFRELDRPLTVVDNQAAHRFEIQTPDGLAELRYRVRGGDTLVLIHTEVPSAIQGHGVASLLTRTALDYARQNAFVVDPRCPYVRAFIERHPEFKDLVRK